MPKNWCENMTKNKRKERNKMECGGRGGGPCGKTIAYIYKSSSEAEQDKNQDGVVGGDDWRRPDWCLVPD